MMSTDADRGSSDAWLSAVGRSWPRSLRRPDASALALLVGVPVAIGLLLGWGRAGQLAPQLSHFGSLSYWVGFAAGVWVLMALCSQLLAVLLAGRVRSVVAIALCGALGATLLTRPFAFAYGNWFLEQVGLELSGRGRSIGLLPGSLAQVGLGVVRSAEWIGIWVAANAFLFHVLRRPRFGIEPSPRAADGVGLPHTAVPLTNAEVPGGLSPALPAPPASPSAPPFLQRAKKDLGTEVIALQAQDHYVRVFTTRDSELLLYRFTDAIREVGEAQGVRVHRSYWVATRAIRRISQRGQRITVELQTGLRVPVSRTFVEELRRRVAARAASRDASSWVRVIDEAEGSRPGEGGSAHPARVRGVNAEPRTGV